MIDPASWKVPAIFGIIGRGGNVDPLEMYQVFNMGIGMVLVVPGKDGEKIAKTRDLERVSKTPSPGWRINIIRGGQKSSAVCNG